MKISVNVTLCSLEVSRFVVISLCWFLWSGDAYVAIKTVGR